MPVHASFVDTLEQVANLALGKVGENKRLTNLETDTGNHADVVRLFISQVIREVQSEFRWSEVTKSVELESPIAENDDTYQYTLPSDYLRPASNRDQDYVIENGYLFTAVAKNFPFRYIRYSEYPEEWSGLMVKCVYFRLALEICMPLTENAQKYNSLLEEYEKVVFPRAKMVGSFDTENPRPRIARGRYSRTRGGVGGALAGAFNRVIGVIAPGHNHDVDYSSIDHLHTGVYALIDHLHTGVYALIDHLHTGVYALIDHLHDARYSLLGHNHAESYEALGTVGAFTVWTPTVSQGGSTNIGKTVNYAKYVKIGNQIHARLSCTVTGTGTGANAIVISGLPAMAFYASEIAIGSGLIVDAGTSNYPGVVIPESATSVKIYAQQATSTAIGQNPNFALANTDRISFSISYEAA